MQGPLRPLENGNPLTGIYQPVTSPQVDVSGPQIHAAKASIPTFGRVIVTVYVGVAPPFPDLKFHTSSVYHKRAQIKRVKKNDPCLWETKMLIWRSWLADLRCPVETEGQLRDAPKRLGSVATLLYGYPLQTTLHFGA